MADIFGRHNSPLEKEGNRIVKMAKEAALKRKEYSRKEIAQSVKEGTSYMRALAVSRTTVILDIPKSRFNIPKPDGIFVACKSQWAERYGKNAQHVECADDSCKCSCHKKKKSKKGK